MSSGVPLCRGQVVLGTLSAVEELAGPEARARILAGLPAEEREVALGAHAALWYPVRAASRVIALACDVLGAGDPGFAAQLGRRAFADDRAGIYRAFVPLVAQLRPVAVLAAGWHHTHKGIPFEVVREGADEERGADVLDVRFLGGGTAAEPPYWFNVEGALVAGLEAGGAAHAAGTTRFEGPDVRVALHYRF